MKEFFLRLLKDSGQNLLILYLAQLKGRMEVLKEQAEANADKQKEYAKIASEYRDVAYALKRLREGSF